MYLVGKSCRRHCNESAFEFLPFFFFTSFICWGDPRSLHRYAEPSKDFISSRLTADAMAKRQRQIPNADASGRLFRRRVLGHRFRGSERKLPPDKKKTSKNTFYKNSISPLYQSSSGRNLMKGKPGNYPRNHRTTFQHG